MSDYFRMNTDGDEIQYERLGVDWDRRVDGGGSGNSYLPAADVVLKYLVHDASLKNFDGYAMEYRFPLVFLFLECQIDTRERCQPLMNHRHYDYNGTVHPKKGSQFSLNGLLSSRNGTEILNQSVTPIQLVPYQLAPDKDERNAEIRSNGFCIFQQVRSRAKLISHSGVQLSPSCFHRLLAFFGLQRQDEGQPVTTGEVCRFLYCLRDYRFETDEDITQFYERTCFTEYNFQRGKPKLAERRRNLVDSVQIQTAFRLVLQRDSIDYLRLPIFGKIM